MNHPVVGGHLNQLATGAPGCDWLTWFTHKCLDTEKPNRVLVLGCGEGWLERSIAGLDWIDTIDAFDVAREAVQRAENRAEEEGFDNINYEVLDLNQDALAPGVYDAVIAHSVLHHIEQLEHGFDQIAGSLLPTGWIVVNEYIGAPHLQYPEAALEAMNGIMRALPERLRVSVTGGHTIDGKGRPSLEHILEVDPSEGVRADELDDFIRGNFSIVYEADLGGTVLQHLLWDMVGNFDETCASDDAILQLLCLLEKTLVEEGALETDYRLYVGRHLSSVTGEKRPGRLVSTTPEMSRSTCDRSSEWRKSSEVVSHLHSLASGNPEGDWLTLTLGRLRTKGLHRESRKGLDRESKVLYIGEESWVTEVLRTAFTTVDIFRLSMLATSIGTFDAIFSAGTGLFNGKNQRRVAALSFLLRRGGDWVSIESGSRPQQNLIDRLSGPVASMLGSSELPALDAERDPVCRPQLFRYESVEPLGGDLLEPILGTYWGELQHYGEVVSALCAVEAELIRSGVFGYTTLGCTLGDPGRAKALKTLFTGS